ncbi:hypothetical protein [Paraburkholderia terrae]
MSPGRKLAHAHVVCHTLTQRADARLTGGHELDVAPPGLWETRGQLQIDGVRRSLLRETGTQLIAALIRESGF